MRNTEQSCNTHEILSTIAKNLLAKNWHTHHRIHSLLTFPLQVGLLLEAIITPELDEERLHEYMAGTIYYVAHRLYNCYMD